jgi:hypothetical protein
MLAAAVQTEGGLEDDSPRRVAVEMDKLLRATPESGHRPSWAFFVAVLLSPRAVHYSLAGRFRVHLMRNGRLLDVSKDQTVAVDSAAEIRFPPGFEDLAGEAVVGDIDSRALGRVSLSGGVKLPPVASAWTEAPPYEVAVCSDGVHRQAHPQTYLDVFRMFSSTGRVPSEHQNDLVAIVSARV